MAISNKGGKLSGKIGDLVYRQVNGQTVVQSRPVKGMVKQAVASKNSAIDFSLASNRARILRFMLYPMIQALSDVKMINRLNAAVAAALRSATALAPGYRDLGDGDFQSLKGFEFNLHSPFARLFLPTLSVSQTAAGGITIGFAAFNVAEQLRFPEPATGLTLKILLAALDLTNNQYRYCASAALAINQQQLVVPATQWNFLADLPPACIYVACAALEYTLESLDGKMKLNRPDLNPVMLCELGHSYAEAQQPPAAPDPSGLWNHWNPIPGLDGRQLLRK